MPCTIELSAWAGSGIPQSGQRRREWKPTSYFPNDYNPDPALYWVMVTEEVDSGDPCAAGTYTRASFDCYGSVGPPGPPQQWQNPRGNNDGNPAGYELCPNGATAGNTAGNFSLCWVQNENDLADDPPWTHIGRFRMHGPGTSAGFECTMGKSCEVALPGRLDDASFDGSAVFVAVGEDSGVCREKLYEPEAVDFNDAARAHGDFSMPAVSASFDGTYRRYSLGVATKAHRNEPTIELNGDLAQRGKYRVCWALTETMFDPNGVDFYDMRKGVDAGPLTLYGPVIGNALSCVLTWDCYFQLEGKFAVGSRYDLLLSEEDDCGGAALTRVNVGGGSWENPINGSASSSFSFQVSFGSPSWGTVGGYTVCWSGGGVSTDADYAVRLGALTVVGPKQCSSCRCHKGEDCLVLLEVVGMTDSQSGNSRVQVLEPGSPCGVEPLPLADLSPVDPEKLQDGGLGAEYRLGLVKSGIAKANYELCWGAGQESGYTMYDFLCTMHVGTFELLGANYRDMSCTLGLPCQLELVGVSLAATNKVVILDLSADLDQCFQGNLAKFLTLGELLTHPTGEPRLAALEADSSQTDTYTMGTPDGVPAGAERSRYLVCWAENPASWDTANFFVPVGKLTIFGPKKATLSCTQSLPCSLTLQGIGLSTANGIAIIPLAGHSCGEAPMSLLTIDGVTNPQRASSATGSDPSMQEVFSMGTPGSAPLEPGTNYQLCWAANPSVETDYRVFVGQFQLKGIFAFSDPPCGEFVPGQDPYCIFGELCEIGDKPTQVSINVEVDEPASTNKLAIVVKTAACCDAHQLVDFREVKPSNLDPAQTSFPNPAPASGGGWRVYNLGRPSLPAATPDGLAVGTPGDYLMCWAHSPSADLADYNTAAGTLQFRGPAAQATFCYLGEVCAVVLRGVFNHFADEDDPHFEWSRALVMPASHACGEEGTTIDPPWVGMVNPSPTADAEDISTTKITYRLGTPIFNDPSTNYKLCWAYNPTGGVLASARLYEEYRVDVGSFTMNGPFPGQNASCNLGEPCVFTLDGIGLAPTNRLLIISAYGGACGNIPPLAPMLKADLLGLTNPGLVTDDALDNKYDMGSVAGGGSYSACRVAEPRETCIGSHYRMCWAHGVDTNALGDYPFYVDVGTFSLSGVYGTYAVQCAMGEVCSFSIFGLYLDRRNQVLVIESSSQCGDAEPSVAYFDGLRNPRRARSVSQVAAELGGGMEVTFRLGQATSGVLGTYRLCWGFDPLVPSDFKVEVGPFHFVQEGTHHECSRWDSHCYQRTSL